MNLLVTINSNYIHPLKVMLKSLFLNNPKETFAVYLMHSSLKGDELDGLERFIAQHGSRMVNVSIGANYFQDAPILLYYSKEMYYRLLASKFLPEQLDRILYLDPDILVINPIQELYSTDLDSFLYAAACHETLPVKEINQLRLAPYKLDAYYNTGVLLMNLQLQRQLVSEREIYDFVEKYRTKLIMPDQDIMNALYSSKIKPLDEKLYNYDVRRYAFYRIRSGGQCDMDFVFDHTVILHFCGRKKPWLKGYSGKFHALYKHYERLAMRS